MKPLYHSPPKGPGVTGVVNSLRSSVLRQEDRGLATWRARAMLQKGPGYEPFDPNKWLVGELARSRAQLH